MHVMSRRPRWLWKLAVAALALVVAVALVEPSAWRVAYAHPEFLVPALAGWLANQCFCALRFYILVNRAGVPLSLRQTMRMTMIGFFAGCVFGGFAANDAVRALMLRHAATDAQLSRLLLLIVLDRVLGFAAFALWALALSYVAASTLDPALAPLMGTIRGVGFGLLAAFAALFALTALAGRARPSPRSALLARMYAVARMGSETRIATGMILAFPLAVLAAGAVIVAQGFIGARIVSELGQAPSFSLQAFLAPTSIIVSILPIVPLGIGLGQLTLSGLYALFGLGIDAAVLLTTIMQAAQFTIAAGLGGTALAAVRRTEHAHAGCAGDVEPVHRGVGGAGHIVTENEGGDNVRRGRSGHAGDRRR